MATEKLDVIQEFEIKNNCPKCFNQEMRLTFYQKHRFSKLFYKVTNKVTHQVQCKKCESFIYPVDWTPDIERIYDYKKKMVTPKKASLKYTGLFYGLIVFSIALVATAIYLFSQGIIQF